MKAQIGALVQYCGHKGYFVADIFIVEDVCVIRANGKVTPDNIIRDEHLGPPTHHLVDFPASGFWNPRIGIFVVPTSQVRVL